MNVCIVFNSKYSNPEPSVSQTMGRDAQQAAKRLRIHWRHYEGKGLQPPPLVKLLKKFNPKMQAFKRVFELNCM